MTAFGDVVCSRQEMCLRYNSGGWSLERDGGSFLFSFFSSFRDFKHDDIEENFYK